MLGEKDREIERERSKARKVRNSDREKERKKYAEEMGGERQR